MATNKELREDMHRLEGKLDLLHKDITSLKVDLSIFRTRIYTGVGVISALLSFGISFVMKVWPLK